MHGAFTALETAAKAGDVESLNLLRTAGADESAWVQEEVPLSEKQCQIEDENLGISFLSIYIFRPFTRLLPQASSPCSAI